MFPGIGFIGYDDDGAQGMHICLLLFEDLFLSVFLPFNLEKNDIWRHFCLHRRDLRVVSDANMFFIETILKHLGNKDYFSEINTNHGCGPCPLNMCKVLYSHPSILLLFSSEWKKINQK